jgi:nucleoside-diphosphate-sugar epimerase
MAVVDGCFLAKDGKPKKQPPLLPIAMQFVDVRDVAKIHVAAMLHPEAAGRRFIAHNKTANLVTVTQWINDEFPIKPTPPPCVKCCAGCCGSCCLPYCCCCMKGNGQMITMAQFVALSWKKDGLELFDNKRSINELGIEYVPLEETVKAHAQSWKDYDMELGQWLKKANSVVPSADSIDR